MSGNENKFINKVLKKAGRTINRHSLVAGGNCVLVGLSGGKDSLVMTDVLSRRRRFLPVSYDVVAVHVKLEGVKYSSDIEYLENFCEVRNVKFVLHTEKINLEGGNKNPCFYCSFNRRRILFQYMKSLGCNKLALGHNMDDAVETFFMNMIFRSRLSSLPYKLSMFGGEFDIIRPLLEIREAQAAEYARLMNFREQRGRCPFENKSNRYKIKKLIEDNEKIYPGFTEKVFYSMGTADLEYLPTKGS